MREIMVILVAAALISMAINSFRRDKEEGSDDDDFWDDQDFFGI